MRKAYVHKVGGQMMRVTFDYNLQAAKSQTLHDKKVFTPVMPGRAVMEVKYDNFLPAFMRYIIQKYNIRRDAYSKYALSVDATRKFHKPER